MGLKNYYRYAKGSRSRGCERAVGIALALQIPDNSRDRPERTSVATLVRLTGYSRTWVVETLKVENLAVLGELARVHEGRGRYQILWGNLREPDDHEPPAEHAEWEELTQFPCPKDSREQGDKVKSLDLTRPSDLTSLGQVTVPIKPIKALKGGALAAVAGAPASAAASAGGATPGGRRSNPASDPGSRRHWGANGRKPSSWSTRWATPSVTPCGSRPAPCGSPGRRWHRDGRPQCPRPFRRPWRPRPKCERTCWPRSLTMLDGGWTSADYRCRCGRTWTTGWPG